MFENFCFTANGDQNLPTRMRQIMNRVGYLVTPHVAMSKLLSTNQAASAQWYFLEKTKTSCFCRPDFKPGGRFQPD